MNRKENAVSDMRMLASETLETLLNQVKSSNLNFNLQQSPLSAIISIKSSFIKDKFGTPLLPPTPPSTGNVLNLEKDMASIKRAYEHSVLDCEETYRTIFKLKEELKIKEEARDESTKRF